MQFEQVGAERKEVDCGQAVVLQHDAALFLLKEPGKRAGDGPAEALIRRKESGLDRARPRQAREHLAYLITVALIVRVSRWIAWPVSGCVNPGGLVHGELREDSLQR